MANKTPLAAWLFSKRGELEPNFTEFMGTSSLVPGLFDFSTKIKWHDVEIEGRGVDECREIALEKSVAECIERIICVERSIDSIGLAVSGGIHNPEAHSRFEALERYYLNQHLEKNILFQKTPSEIDFDKSLKERNPKCEITFFQMITPESLFGVVCQIEENNKMSFGFALSESLIESQRRSFLEAIPSFSWLKIKNEKNHTNSKVPWQISEEFISRISPLLNTVVQHKKTDLVIPELLREEIDCIDIPVLNSAPIQVSRYNVKTSGGKK